MGYRTFRVYKGISERDLKHAMESAATDFHGSIDWSQPGKGDQYLGLRHNEMIHTVYIPYQSIDSQYCERVGEILGCVWIEVRMQDNAIWDYALSRGRETIDLFSVCPQYWDSGETEEESLQEWQGKPQILADAWQVPIERISRYLANWGYRKIGEDFEYSLNGKAYPTDDSEYGDYSQYSDFLSALGGGDTSEAHTLVIRRKINS